MSDQNPYAPPTPSQAVEHSGIVLEPNDRKKVEAIIKDAGQFWLAIMLCIFCSAIGAIIIPVWYLVRLLQWNGLARKYPELANQNVPPGSVQDKFKSSQWKLIVGLVVGITIFFGMIAYIIVFWVVAANRGL